jgi:hypothetical protein
MAVSDRFALGLGFHTWRLRNLRTGQEETIEAAVQGTARVVDDRRFLVSDHHDDGDRLHMLSADRTIAPIPLPAEAAGLRLMRLPVLMGRWAPLGVDTAVWTRDGSPPTIRWLDLETGEVTVPVTLDLGE